MVWIGISDANIEGAYQFPIGTYLDWSNFATGEPNGAENENCVIMMADGTWADLGCDGSAYPLCEVETGTVILMWFSLEIY